MSGERLRNLPAVARLLAHPALAGADPGDAAAAARAELAHWRAALLADPTSPLPPLDALADAARTRLAHRPRLREVINATGVVLHTNLGRAPLSDAAADAVGRAARRYTNLELDLETGSRSSRQHLVRAALCRLTGAESAVVVNNCAAATVLTLRALAAGREVVVSRGQLIEIGGSYRLPEIFAASGAVLKEVGTTNITRLSDYEKAITPATALILRVHTSNYRVRGFTQSVGLADLAASAKAKGVLLVDDAGSGAAVDLSAVGLEGEPDVRESLKLGADLVLFSGDKLLGGPQAGVIAGARDCVERVERDPLSRAMRLDKLSFAALEATLHAHRSPAAAWREVPVLAMLAASLDGLRARAAALAAALASLPGVAVTTCDGAAYAGGGTLPDQPLPTALVGLTPADGRAHRLAARLRRGTPAVLARTHAGAVWLDPRCVFPDQEAALIQAARAASQAADGEADVGDELVGDEGEGG